MRLRPRSSSSPFPTGRVRRPPTSFRPPARFCSDFIEASFSACSASSFCRAASCSGVSGRSVVLRLLQTPNEILCVEGELLQDSCDSVVVRERDRIEFVIVATGTQPSVIPKKAVPSFATCVSIWSASIFALSGSTISTSPTIRNPVAVMFSARSSRRRGGQQVAGNLFPHEAVERLVVVIRLDQVIAVAPSMLGEDVVRRSHHVGIAGQIEPMPGPTFAVRSRSEQPINDGFPSARRACHATNASISAGVGGRPVRSRLTRRSQVWRSASATGRSPACSSRASTKRSSGSIGHDASFTAGVGGSATGWKAQNRLRPCSRSIPCEPQEVHPLGADRAPPSRSKFRNP
jgi:hypothetical protein